MKNTRQINRVNIETKLKNYLIKFDNKDYFMIIRLQMVALLKIQYILYLIFNYPIQLRL